MEHGVAVMEGIAATGRQAMVTLELGALRAEQEQMVLVIGLAPEEVAQGPAHGRVFPDLELGQMDWELAMEMEESGI